MLNTRHFRFCHSGFYLELGKLGRNGILVKIVEGLGTPYSVCSQQPCPCFTRQGNVFGTGGSCLPHVLDRWLWGGCHPVRCCWSMTAAPNNRCLFSSTLTSLNSSLAVQFHWDAIIEKCLPSFRLCQAPLRLHAHIRSSQPMVLASHWWEPGQRVVLKSCLDCIQLCAMVDKTLIISVWRILENSRSCQSRGCFSRPNHGNVDFEVETPWPSPATTMGLTGEIAWCS